MKNTLTDLNNHLFMQLERLNDEDISAEDISKEIERSKAVTSVAKVIIENGRLALDTLKHMDGQGYNDNHDKVPEMLEVKTNKK